MSDRRDEEGQPGARFNAKRVQKRTVDELIGICKGLVADNRINSEEAGFLATWLKANLAQAYVWPVKMLNKRIWTMLDDGVIDDVEKIELLSMLKALSGEHLAHEHVASFSATLPQNSPPPPVLFEGKCFCFTGKFAFGTRADCTAQVAARSGYVDPDVTSSLDYLVIGLMGSRDWKHSTFGRKIEAAMEYREKGCRVAIIGEEHWTNCL